MVKTINGVPELNNKDDLTIKIQTPIKNTLTLNIEVLYKYIDRVNNVCALKPDIIKWIKDLISHFIDKIIPHTSLLPVSCNDNYYTFPIL